MKRVLCCLDAVKEHNEGDYERAGVVSKCFQNFVSYEVPSTPNLSARAPRAPVAASRGPERLQGWGLTECEREDTLTGATTARVSPRPRGGAHSLGPASGPHGKV